ncbi:MAG: DUF4153 domain-containing protein [Balneola sp.]|jgi:hypothetical protein
MKLNLPSVNEIAQRSLNTTKRFPFAIFSALAATISAICFSEIEFSNTKDYYWLSDMIFVSVLGVSFFTGIQTFSESLKWDNIKNIIAKGTGLLMLVGYYFLPEGYLTEGANEVFYRYFVLFLISHLFVAFAPFIKNPDVNEFWGYNKTLFLNFLISALYSAVLFFGLSIALLSIDNLLGFDVKDQRFMQLWIFLVGVFNTFFFLARVPKMGEFEPSVTEYPKALKVFVQYVLIPIVTIYILILYSYLVKIIVQWELPTGWVAKLVLSFSIAGIFSLLLLHPIKDEAKNNWIRLYSKLYYIGLVPLVVLLFVSIGTRISEYGVTINRFYVATLAVWLAGIVIYFIVSKSKNIKVIPISLALIGLGITFGPLSAFSVSERSQQGRITEILDSNNMLSENGTVITDSTKVPLINKKEFFSLVRYLVHNHGIESMQPFFNEDIENIVRGNSSKIDVYKITNAMGIDRAERGQNDDALGEYFSFISRKDEQYEIKGYDYLLSSVYMGSNPVDQKGEFKISYNQLEDRIIILDEGSQKSISVEIEPVVNSLTSKFKNTDRVSAEVSSSLMKLEGENEDFKVKLILENLSGYRSDTLWVKHLKTHIFIKLK